MAALPQELAPLPVPQQAPQRPLRGPAPIRVVRPRRRRGGRYLLAMAALGALSVFGSVSLNALAAEQSFAVRELERDVGALTRRADELTVEVTRLESPDRIHAVAVEELGMVTAKQPAFLVLPGAASRESDAASRTMAASASGG